MPDSRARRTAWSFLFGVIASEGAALAFLFRAKGNWFAAVAHYTVTPPGNTFAWLMALAVTALYVAYAATRSPLIAAHMLHPSTWGPFAVMRLVALPMALISGFFEEAFFRKFLVDWALHSGLGGVLQVAISALVFGAAHAIWGLFGGNLRAAASAMAATGVLGGLLAMVYLVGDRSLAPCAASHTAINLLIEPWLILAAATGSWGRSAAAE